MAKTSELIKQTKNDLSRLESELESAKATREQYNRELTNARARLKRKENSPYPDNLAIQFVEQMKKGNIPEATLISHIDEAIEKNIEFSDKAYKEALYSVANDKTIYKFFKRGQGWQSDIDLQIVFESTAGFLGDWAHAVSIYRDLLKSKGLESEKAGRKASEFWYDKVYGTSLETKTIKGRLNQTDRKAPFWWILNYGTQPMHSDRPGGFTQVFSTPTHFIEEAEREIEDQFLSLLRTEFARWNEEEQELKDIIAEYEEKRDEYSQDIKEIRTDLRLTEKVFQSFREKKEFADKGKILKAVKRLRAGEEFDKPVINVSLKGSGKKTLLDVRKLEGLIYD